MTCRWRGHSESIFEFEPTNSEQVALVVKLVGAKRRQVVTLTPEPREALVARFAEARARKAA